MISVVVENAAVAHKLLQLKYVSQTLKTFESEKKNENTAGWNSSFLLLICRNFLSTLKRNDCLFPN